MFQYKSLSSPFKRKTSGVKKGNVLIVDDDVAMRTILVSVLSKDFDVEAKRNGMEAMNWLSEGNLPDVIVSDIMMPQLNGYDFIRALRQSGVYATIPVLVLSGHDVKNTEEEVLRLGADSYLSKPFDPRVILDFVLKAHLQNVALKRPSYLRN